MILYTQNQDEFIDSYVEFDVVNKDGKTTNNGEYLFIRDIWVHPEYRGEKVISQFVEKLDNLEATKNVKYIYWERTEEKEGKKYQRISPLFSRETCLHVTKQFLRRF